MRPADPALRGRTLDVRRVLMSNLFASHPPMEERVRQLRAMAVTSP
jgi:Zn-dependent protease with chaperone function